MKNIYNASKTRIINNVLTAMMSLMLFISTIELVEYMLNMTPDGCNSYWENTGGCFSGSIACDCCDYGEMNVLCY